MEPARAPVGAEFRLHRVAFGLGGYETPAKVNRGVRVEMRQGSEGWELASVDVGRDSAFDVRSRVPAGASPGRAVVRAAAGPKAAEGPFVVADEATGPGRP